MQVGGLYWESHNFCQYFVYQANGPNAESLRNSATETERDDQCSPNIAVQSSSLLMASLPQSKRPILADFAVSREGGREGGKQSVRRTRRKSLSLPLFGTMNSLVHSF